MPNTALQPGPCSWTTRRLGLAWSMLHLPGTLLPRLSSPASQSSWFAPCFSAGPASLHLSPDLFLLWVSAGPAQAWSLGREWEVGVGCLSGARSHSGEVACTLWSLTPQGVPKP